MCCLKILTSASNKILSKNLNNLKFRVDIAELVLAIKAHNCIIKVFKESVVHSNN